MNTAQTRSLVAISYQPQINTTEWHGHTGGFTNLKQKLQDIRRTATQCTHYKCENQL
jgi:hypothetical protein